MTVSTLSDLLSEGVEGRTVLVRSDLNVPLDDAGVITDAGRIIASVPTLKALAEAGAKVIVTAHLGRPKGAPDPKFSLAPVAAELAERLGRNVQLAGDVVGQDALARAEGLTDGDVLLLENTRFHPEEEKNEPGFVKRLAALGDIYVNDAFSAAHRAHASTEGLAHLLPSYAGRTMQAELDALSHRLIEHGLAVWDQATVAPPSPAGE